MRPRIGDRCLTFSNEVCTAQMELPQYQLTNAVNVAGYISWGNHGSLGLGFVTNLLSWGGNSRWWIIETIESYNGKRDDPNTFQSNFLQWFSENAFGGTGYLNTPVGAVSNVSEPGLGGVNKPASYFGLWASKKNFAISAWNSKGGDKLQAVGDPLVIK